MTSKHVIKQFLDDFSSEPLKGGDVIYLCGTYSNCSYKYIYIYVLGEVIYYVARIIEINFGARTNMLLAQNLKLALRPGSR